MQSWVPKALLSTKVGRMLARYRHRRHTRDASKATNRFVLLSHGRSGSNMLLSALNQHPMIEANYEVFHQSTIYLAQRTRSQLWKRWLIAIRDRYPDEFLTDFVFEARDPATLAVGLKVFAAHYSDERFQRTIENLLADPETKIIRLYRGNKLASYVSYERAVLSRKWSSSEPSDVVEPPFHVDPRKLQAYVMKVEAEIELFDRLTENRTSMTLEYDDLINHWSDRMDALQHYVGVSPEPVSPTIARQRTTPLRNNISNFDELRKDLGDAKFRSLFEGSEDEPPGW